MADNEDKISQFCSVSSIAREDGVRYLQESEWDVERALNKFFQDTECKDDVDLARQLQDSSHNEDVTSPEQDGCLKLLCWNIDGLDKNDTLHRTLAVCHIINIQQPDVVFLQEVIAETLTLIKKQCINYDVKCHDEMLYFCAILVKKSTVKLASKKKVIKFPNSNMGRLLLLQNVRINDIPVCLITTHLESTQQCWKERKSQLKQCFDVIARDCTDTIVLFGGDLNIRDAEIKDLGGLPCGIKDAWELAGSPDDAKFSWDMSINDNLSIPSKPRCRFDRIFVQSSTSKNVNSNSFNFVGCERLLSCGRFPSDHWGLLFQFTID